MFKTLFFKKLKEFLIFAACLIVPLIPIILFIIFTFFSADLLSDSISFAGINNYLRMFANDTISLIALFNTVIAVGFNPSGGNSGDDETYKEYTAKLLDFQFNTIMALNLDDEFGMDMETPITMLGAIQLHHVKDSQV